MSKSVVAIAFAVALPATGAGPNLSQDIPPATHDWGCEVLLCLANPEGPMAVAESVPPIRRLWRELARGHAFPTCAMASGPDGRSYAPPAYRFYDPCPPGSSELAAGATAQLFPPTGTAVPPTPSGM